MLNAYNGCLHSCKENSMNVKSKYNNIILVKSSCYSYVTEFKKNDCWTYFSFLEPNHSSSIQTTHYHFTSNSKVIEQLILDYLS